MKATIRRPTSIRLKADEMVTMAVCCTVVSSTAPITGPIQVPVPPISGMAMVFTA